MGSLDPKGTSNRWLITFIDWIRPDPRTEETIKKQAEEVRESIKAEAVKDGLTVRSIPFKGSFAKKTGLRRHVRGNLVIEGEDVDLGFILSPRDEDGKKLDRLLDKLERYAQARYKHTSRHPTKSSLCLDFKSTKLSYDLVPLLAVQGDDEAQELLRRDGTRRKTSVQKHNQFVRMRTDKSNQQKGPVRFNDMVRLVKWWRHTRELHSRSLHNVPTILIDLLCAEAFDRLGVDETYTETLSRWFTHIAGVVRNRRRIRFADFGTAGAETAGRYWAVLDPVNPQNNTVPDTWDVSHIHELASWFESGRDVMARVIAADHAGNDAAVRRELITLFGDVHA